MSRRTVRASKKLVQSRAIKKAKTPKNYYQAARVAKANASITFAKKFGLSCRYLDDRAGTEAWIETGIWPTQEG